MAEFNLHSIRSDDLLTEDIVVAIMGPTGSGKSNFIDHLTGQSSKETRLASSRLESSTRKVQAIRIKNHREYRNKIVLVDTPGFDDTNRSDMEILELIAKWLKKTYKAHVKLSGVIYLHRITDNRMSGSPHRNLRMFGELCGDKAMEKVLLVTTMWDKVDPSVGDGRETELRNRYWATMIKYRAQSRRFDNTEASAWSTLHYFIEHEKNRQVLLLQEELVDLKLRLNETQAGMALYHELQALLAKQRDTIKNLEVQVQHDPQIADTLRSDKMKAQAEIDGVFKQLQAMKISLTRRVVLLFKREARGHPVSIDSPPTPVQK